MNNQLRFWRTCAILLAIISAFFLILLYKYDNPSKTPIAIDARAPIADPSSQLRRSAPTPRGETKPDNALEHLKSAVAQKPSPQQIKSFLDSQGRDAKSLLAAYDITQDEAFLQEALEAHPDSPEVLVLALSTDAGQSLLPSKEKAIDALLDQRPESAVGNIMKAALELTKGDTQKAISAFRASVAYEFDLNELPRKETMQDLWAHLGKAPAEAKFLANTKPLKLPSMLTIDLKRLGNFMVRETEKATQEGDIDRAIDHVQTILQYRYATQQMLGNSTQLMESESNRVALLAISAIDETIPYGDAGKTVGDLRTEIVKRQVTLSEANTANNRVLSFFQRSPKESLDEYVDLLSQGKAVDAALYVSRELAGLDGSE